MPPSVFASEADCAEKIKSLYEDTGYVIDTHTSVAAAGYDKYVKATGDSSPVVIASTASPFKFLKSVITAIDSKYADSDDFELIDVLSKTSNVDVPQAIEDIRNAVIVHDTVCDVNEMKSLVMENMGL